MLIPTTPPYCEAGAPVGASPPLDVGAATRARGSVDPRLAPALRSPSSAISSLMEL